MMHMQMLPAGAFEIYLIASVLSLLTHIYVMRRSRKLEARNTAPMVGIMQWSQAIMAINCAAMAIVMAGIMYAPLGWLVALSQVVLFVHTWMMAKTLDDL